MADSGGYHIKILAEESAQMDLLFPVDVGSHPADLPFFPGKCIQRDT